MTGFKKRIVVFLTTVALGGSVLLVCSAQSATESEESILDPCQPQVEAESETGFLFADDPDLSDRTDYGPGGLRVALAVLFVVALGAGAIYVSKKLLPRIANLPGKQIRVVETVYLGPRKAVHLIEIGDRRLLIGSTNENIRKLADITGELPDLSSQEAGYD
ncbi:MAG: flagellar biosynthetic protein FliO [Planctomycetota bacterium]